jgi:hypothetical protein
VGAWRRYKTYVPAIGPFNEPYNQVKYVTEWHDNPHFVPPH